MGKQCLHDWIGREHNHAPKQDNHVACSSIFRIIKIDAASYFPESKHDFVLGAYSQPQETRLTLQNRDR